MHSRLLSLSLMSVIVCGCTSVRHDTSIRAVNDGAEAARARYRAIQAAQKPLPVSTRYEVVPLERPERTEDGIIRTPASDYIRIPRVP
jgi:hypothetical protein